MPATLPLGCMTRRHIIHTTCGRPKERGSQSCGSGNKLVGRVAQHLNLGCAAGDRIDDVMPSHAVQRDGRGMDITGRRAIGDRLLPPPARGFPSLPIRLDVVI